MYLLVSALHAQEQEDIVMKIGGVPVCKNEFIKEYNNSQSLSVKEFLPHFILRRVRIMDLQQKGIDTLTSFKILLTNYKGEKLKSFYKEKYRDSIYKTNVNNRFSDNSWVKLQIIEKYIPQNSSKLYCKKQKESSDSIFNLVKNVVDFSELLIKYSDNIVEVKPIWSKKNLLPIEVIPMVENAKPGDVIPPVLTPSGYCIIKLYDISTSLPEEVAENNFERYLSNNKKLASFEKVDLEDLKLELLYKIASANDTIADNISESDLKEYFNKNKSNYNYDEPRFKGAIIHCSSKKMAKAISKYLKKYDFTDWQNALDKLTQNDEKQMVKMERGIFKRGENSFVDKLVFKVKSEKTNSSPTFPYSFKIGKILKKRPDNFSDIREKVKSDLVNSRVFLKNHALIEKYKVEIDDEVLKTVNNSGSN